MCVHRNTPAGTSGLLSYHVTLVDFVSPCTSFVVVSPGQDFRQSALHDNQVSRQTDTSCFLVFIYRRPLRGDRKLRWCRTLPCSLTCLQPPAGVGERNGCVIGFLPIGMCAPLYASFGSFLVCRQLLALVYLINTTTHAPQRIARH
jgi:hypothetical protein